MKKWFVILSQTFLITLLIISLFGTMLLLPVLKNLDNPNLQSTATYDWTYMVYCDADNNLDSYGVEDVNEMEYGYENDVSSHVKVIVLIDRETSGAKTYNIAEDTSIDSTIESPILTTGFPSEPNMGSKTTLKNFITYCFSNYPADHYVLDLWDHGGGIFGICWDDTSSNDKLTFDEVDEAISESCAAAAEEIDILTMDACLMAMIETCYEWRDYVDFVVASEETIPGYGYPYNTMIDKLCTTYGTYNSNPGQYAYDMVTLYHNSYSSGDDTTLSSINVQSPFDNLMTAFNAFTSALALQIGSAKSSIASARAATQEFYYAEFIDLYDFAKEIQSRIPLISSKCASLMSNITTVVTHSLQHDNPDAHGISIYFPETQGDYDSGYASIIDFGQETQWADFLYSYYTGVVNTYALSITSYAVDIHGDGIPEQGETINISISVKNTGNQDASLVNGTISSDDTNVTILDGFNLYGPINAGIEITKEFQLSIAMSAPNGLVVAITCIVQAMFGVVPYGISKILTLVINLSALTGGSDFESAQTIPQGISNGLLPGPDPTDSSAWFKISVAAGYYLLCSIISADAGTDFDLYIYSPAGDLLTAAVLASYPDACSTYTPITGEYRIRVTPYTGSGSFTLNVTISGSSGPEDGLSFGTAFTIHQNTTMPQTGDLPSDSGSGYMFYRVYLTRGQSITVSLTADSSTDFDLYIADGSFDVVDSSAGVSYPEKLRFSAPSDGYYYIVVVPYSGSGSYELTVSFAGGFTLDNWVIVLIVILVIAAIIVGLILYFKMT